MFKGSEYWGSGPQEPWHGADSIRFSLHPRSRSLSLSSIVGTRRQLSLRLHSLTLNELYQAFPYNWVRQPCDLLPANFFFFEKMFISWIILKILHGYARWFEKFG